MARTLKSPESLKKESSKLRYSGIKYLFYGLMGITFGLLVQQLPQQKGIIGNLISSTSALAVVFLFFMFLRYNKSRQQAAIYDAGQQGEKKLAEALENLSDEYFLIHDIVIKINNKKSQLDHVVIGPNGIFVIESKNLNGTIVGKEDDDEWKQLKVGRRGGEYSKTFYNPTKQVRTHVYNLRQQLKRQKNNTTWIQPVVAFTSDKVELKIDTKEIPVLLLSDLGRYIKNYRGQNVLSKSERYKISEYILKVCS